MSAAPEKYRDILSYNPISSIIEGFRYILLGNSSFDFSALTYTACFATVFLLLGIVVFNKVEKNFVDTV
jgi:lipopolysaccharide transport system permease protein